MTLDSFQLQAFYEVAKERSFSKAARKLSLTQSALSQRVARLEDQLEATLFVRDRSSVRLTEIGQDLLRFCQSRQSMEEEFLSRYQGRDSEQLAGVLRIGGHSSVMRSAIMPAMEEILSVNRDFHVEFLVREMKELPTLLHHAEIDLVILNYVHDKSNLVSHLLGEEENVLVAPIKSRPGSPGSPSPQGKEIYLDHDADDPTTEQFLKAQGLGQQPFKRRYLDDIYGIIDGVRMGWGLAVIPVHLIRNDPKVKIMKKFRSLRNPVALHYCRRPYYSRTFRFIVDHLCKEVRNFL